MQIILLSSQLKPMHSADNVLPMEDVEAMGRYQIALFNRTYFLIFSSFLLDYSLLNYIDLSLNLLFLSVAVF